jgi:hypothetical protein
MYNPWKPNHNYNDTWFWWLYGCTKILRWWEKPVEVERQIVELLVPTIPAKCPEPSPPRHPTVLGSVPHVQRVI